MVDEYIPIHSRHLNDHKKLMYSYSLGVSILTTTITHLYKQLTYSSEYIYIHST